MFVNANQGQATIGFRCKDGHGIQGYVPTVNNGPWWSNGPGNGSDPAWMDVQIDMDPAWPSQHNLLYNVTSVAMANVEAYNITIDGVQLPGVYLGTNNSVRWAFSQDSFLPLWSVRLMEDGFAGDNPPDYMNRYEIPGLLTVLQ
jgi:hypothetical protein